MTVQPLTAFQSWQLQYFGTTASTGSSAATADPAGDGMSNLLKYALGADPLASGVQQLPTATTVGGKLELTFTRARSDVTYLVEGSSDLQTWSTLATNPGVVGQSVTVQDTASSTPRFLRLQITQP